MRFLDFPLVYGKLGDHPGMLGPPQAEALFRHGMTCPAGATFVEYWPDGGRSTVILGAVAKNLNARLNIFTDWSHAPQGAPLWFNRALKTHGLLPMTAVNPPEVAWPADLMVLREELLRQFPDILASSQTKKLFVLGSADGLDRKLLESGEGYSVWEGKA